MTVQLTFSDKETFLHEFKIKGIRTESELVLSIVVTKVYICSQMWKTMLSVVSVQQSVFVSL